MNNNQRTTIIVFGIIAIIIILIPLFIYSLKFKDQTFSFNNQDWSHFGSYMNGVLAPIIALTGALITIVLNALSQARNRALSEREEMSQRPLMHVYSGDYENRIKISMLNKGLGALIITKYEIINTVTNEKHGSFFDLVKQYDDKLENYTGDMTDQVLSPEEEKELFLSENPWKDETKTSFKKDHDEYKQFAEELRNIFKDLKIVINYKNIYNTEMDTYELDLKWYGRMNEVNAT